MRMWIPQSLVGGVDGWPGGDRGCCGIFLGTTSTPTIIGWSL